MILLLSSRCQLKKVFQKVSKVFSVHNFCTIPNKEEFRTSKNNPGKHTLQDEGLYYSIENSVSLNKLFRRNKGLPSEFFEECITFEETAIMIRKPALEIINYLKKTNFKNPINKYVIYGKYGSGVTTTLAHVIHYAYLNDWLIVHVPRVKDFGCSKTEVCHSSTRPGFLDLPTMGSEWLSHFRTQNIEIINKLDLKIQNEYIWNIEEVNKAGESLLGLVDHGIARGRYSCEVIIALLDEIKTLSKMEKVKTLVAIDEYSSIFHPKDKNPKPRVKYYDPAKISCIPAFKNMAIPDWHNGAAVLTCNAIPNASYTAHYPLTELTKKGFELLDPFVPIEVPELTNKEISNMLAFYKSKNWLRSSDGDKELIFLSGKNALSLRNICAPL